MSPVKRESSEILDTNRVPTLADEDGNVIDQPRDGIVSSPKRESRKARPGERSDKKYPLQRAGSGQFVEDTEDVIKHTPSPSMATRNSPSRIHTEIPLIQSTETLPAIQGRTNLNVQAMSQNVKQVTITEYVDEVPEDNSPISYKQDSPPTAHPQGKSKSFARYEPNEDSDDNMFDNVEVAADIGIKVPSLHTKIRRTANEFPRPKT